MGAFPTEKFTKAERQKLTICPVCGAEAYLNRGAAAANALWVQCITCGYHAAVWRNRISHTETEGESHEQHPTGNH